MAVELKFELPAGNSRGNQCPPTWAQAPSGGRKRVTYDSMADAIIFASAPPHHARIVTGDVDFEGLAGVTSIR